MKCTGAIVARQVERIDGEWHIIHPLEVIHMSAQVTEAVRAGRERSVKMGLDGRQLYIALCEGVPGPFDLYLTVTFPSGNTDRLQRVTQEWSDGHDSYTFRFELDKIVIEVREPGTYTLKLMHAGEPLTSLAFPVIWDGV